MLTAPSSEGALNCLPLYIILRKMWGGGATEKLCLSVAPEGEITHKQSFTQKAKKAKGNKAMLTSKQRAYLRSLASNYDTIYQIGKGGISDMMVTQLDATLEARELIKLRTLDMCDYGPHEAGEILAERLGADLVTVTGTRFVLYRESKKKKRIELP